MAPAQWRYIPALDGVRALAVAAVVGFHWWPETFGGGFIGVDVFFVLSGYLITAMLLAEQNTRDRIDLRSFWMRRVRRLLPAVWFLVAVATFVVVVDGTASARWLVEAIGALTWTSNWLGLHFDAAPWWHLDDRGALSHLWSLAIEEQFYLVWPLVMMGFFRWLPQRRRQLVVVLAMVVASAWAMSATDQITAYFATHTRSFGLLLGAALAISGMVLPRRWSAFAAPGAVAAFAVFTLLGDPNDGWMYPWGFLGVALTAALLTSSLLDGGDASAAASAAWLEWGPLRYVGRVSYGVYLWHVPIAAFLTEDRLGVGELPTSLLRIAALVVAVEMSYLLIEDPIRTRKVVLASPRVMAMGVAIALLAVPLVAAARDDVDNPWVVADSPPSAAEGDHRTMVVGDLAAAAVLADLEAQLAASGEPDGVDGPVALWGVGDVGCVFSEVENARTADDHDFGRDDYCVHWAERWTDAIERFEPDTVLIVAGYGDTLELFADGEPVGDGELGSLYVDTVEAIVAAVPDSVGELAIVALDPISPLAGEERDPADRDRAAAIWATAAADVASRDDRITACRPPPEASWPDVAADLLPLVTDASVCPR